MRITASGRPTTRSRPSSKSNAITAGSAEHSIVAGGQRHTANECRGRADVWIRMGLGPDVLALYRQIKLLGAFDNVTEVLELGSQGVWCPDSRLLTGLFEAFGKRVPPERELRP